MRIRDGLKLYRLSQGIILCLAIGAALLMPGCAHTPPPAPRDPALAVPSIWPVDHASRQISSPFGQRSDPRRFRDKVRMHGGVDISVPKGTPVLAAGDGTVAVAARKRDGLGKRVILNHGNGYHTLYAHLSSVKTKPGRRVLRGEVIGVVGKSGRATGPHLHYEVHHNAKRVDPASYLR